MIGLIGKRRQGFGRLDEFTQLGNKDCAVLFGVEYCPFCSAPLHVDRIRPWS